MLSQAQITAIAWAPWLAWHPSPTWAGRSENVHMHAHLKPNQSPHELPDQHAHWLKPLAWRASQDPRHTLCPGRDKQPMQPAPLRGRTAWQKKTSEQSLFLFPWLDGGA